MTASITFNTVTSSIAALSISGVTVKSSAQITSSRLSTHATLSPRPERFITDLEVEAGEISKQKMTVRYTLNYVYYHTQIGSVLDFPEYADLLTNISAILVALMTNNSVSGALDLDAPTVSDIGPVLDPAGNVFLGCVISLRILQFVELP